LTRFVASDLVSFAFVWSQTSMVISPLPSVLPEPPLILPQIHTPIAHSPEIEKGRKQEP
jgi:hypothetical protein